MQQTTDDSKDFFNEMHVARLDLVKEVFELLGFDLGESKSNVKYRNYMDSAWQGGAVLTLGDNGFGYGNVDFSNYTGKAISVDTMVKLFPRGNRNYIAAAVSAIDKYGSKVGLNDIGKLMVLGQFAHESGDFIYTHEIGFGRGKPYGRPAGPYGKIYYGRGPIQITWEANYKYISEKCFPKVGINANIHADPDLCCRNLEIGCAASLCWFMIPGNGRMGINCANGRDIKGLTKAINGGFNTLDQRIAKTQKIVNAVRDI